MTVDADISVIIAAFTAERWDNIVAAIESVQRQTLAPRELIVVPAVAWTAPVALEREGQHDLEEPHRCEGTSLRVAALDTSQDLVLLVRRELAEREGAPGTRDLVEGGEAIPDEIAVIREARRGELPVEVAHHSRFPRARRPRRHVRGQQTLDECLHGERLLGGEEAERIVRGSRTRRACQRTIRPQSNSGERRGEHAREPQNPGQERSPPH